MAYNHSNWHEMLSYTFMAHRTSIRKSTATTLYSLVYYIEAILPIKVEILSLWILVKVQSLESKLEHVQYD